MADDSGLQRLLKRLDRMPAKAKAAARASLDKSADEMVAMAQRLAPVDTGALRQSIKKAPGRHELEVVVQAGGSETMRPMRKGTVLFDYAFSQEFGTMDQPAHPFFWPAYRLIRKTARRRTKRAISKAIKEGS